MRSHLALAAALALAACEAPPEATKPIAPPAPPLQTAPTPVVSQGPSTVAPAPKTAEAAAKALRDYYARLAAKDYPQAAELWSADGADPDALARQMAGFDAYRAEVGPPGRVEGAAGSLYVEIPVTVQAVRRTGGPQALSGKAVMRRVNDVPGATPKQLTWRIQSIDLTAAG